eukprot:scaffold12316_cov113-Isochrysis_galbana.AAC.2
MKESHGAPPQPSGCPDPMGPSAGPRYWGAKEAGYSDAGPAGGGAHAAAGGGSDGGGASAAAVGPHELVYLRQLWDAAGVFYFMDPVSAAPELSSSPEVWLSSGGGGAQAHVDGHCESTISVQLSGRKRWRLGHVQVENVSPLRPSNTYEDGMAYRHPGGWAAGASVELQAGEALVFPPGMVHETLTTSEECAVSVTFQFATPPALRHWRNRLATLRRLWDVHECWPRFDVAYAAMLGPNLPRAATQLGGLLPGAVPALAAQRHRQLDADGDGCVANHEMPPPPRRAIGRSRWAEAMLRLFDADGDGCVSELEMAAELQRWARIQRAISEEWLPPPRIIQKHFR